MSPVIQTLWVLALVLLLAPAAAGQVVVHPTGVNVNAAGPTVVFLTYGGLSNGYEPAEAMWCGELLDAFPDIGQRCDPATLFGRVPLGSGLATPSGAGGLTDIMAIPASVARRAYQAAAAGAPSAFFYVRRFVSTAGGPDVYVPVTCRLAGGGARVPFALLDVQLAFDTDVPLLSVRAGEPMPAVYAEIAYNGTGQLRGRWEIVRPGEEPPAERDLLTEATLPIEQRGTQRRYTEVERFSFFLPPSTRRFRLPGPDPSTLPTEEDGLYLLLLRIEATDDKEGDSNLASVDAGGGVVHSGAVAGFPIPPLRYYVGSAASQLVAPRPGQLAALAPATDAALAPEAPVDFSWTTVPQATLYRLEVQTTEGEPVLSALVRPPMAGYRAPAWLPEQASNQPMHWRIVALNSGGAVLDRTGWRSLRFGTEQP